MSSYIGTKIVQAEPMNKYDFFISRKGRDCKEDHEEGYMVTYEDGYESWSPKAVFERCYRLITTKEKLLIQ